MSCKVYIACKMSGRSKLGMVRRAEYVCNVFKRYGLEAISPVLEEGVKPVAELLDPNVIPLEDVKRFWARDKEIIRKESHVVFMDGAHNKSYGMEREYALNRFCLWKPTVLLIHAHEKTIIADLEDDLIATDIHHAAKFIADNFGTWRKRGLWRIKMLARTLPKWIYYQLLAWR